MVTYRKRHGDKGIEIVINDDGSGIVQTWEGIMMLEFDNEAGLKEGLKK